MEFRKFIFGETLEKAIDAVPEEYQLKFYRYIKEYGLHGIEPELIGFELSTWVQMKSMIDITMPKKNNASPVCKVGAPYGNKNAQKSIPYNSFNSLELNSKNNINNSENKLNNSNEISNVNGNVNLNNNENSDGNGNSEKPQPLLINKIREEARKLDIILGTDLAAKAAATGIESAWLDGDFNFPAFVLERLRENSEYRRKPRHEMALLFAAAFAWENLRQEYPLWKQGKEHELEELEKMKIMENARQNHPQKCGECGKELTEYDGKYWCRACNTYYSLDEKTLKWERGK